MLLSFSYQSNYQLDTSYKYVSLLVVGRGGYGKDTDNALNAPKWYGGCMGGNSGIVAYRKNISINTDAINGMTGFSTINFSGNYSYNSFDFTGLLVEYNEYLGRRIVVFLGNASNGQGHRTNDYYVFTVNGKSDYDLFSYAWNEGGLATSVKVSGAGGSYADGITTIAGTGSGIQAGGEGGDGRFGHQGPDYNSGTSASTTIPIQSIFGGTGCGAGSYFTSTSNCKAGGAGGYGDGNMNGKAGYGAGGTAFKISSSSTDLYNEGDGIVCLYYHNNPL